MRWRGTSQYNVTVMRISTVIGGKARYHIRRWPYVVWVRALCTVQVRIWTLNNAHGLFVLANWYTLAGFIFPGGSDRINWEHPRMESSKTLWCFMWNPCDLHPMKCVKLLSARLLLQEPSLFIQGHRARSFMRSPLWYRRLIDPVILYVNEGMKP